MGDATDQDSATASLREAVLLDNNKLHGPTGNLYLLRYLDLLEVALQQADGAAVSGTYNTISQSLSRFWAPALPQDKKMSATLGRPLRRSLGRIYTILFAKRDCKGLFDSARLWLASMNDPKLNTENRLVVAQILQCTLSAHGAQILTLLPEILAVCAKLFRQPALPMNFRYTICQCARSAIFAGGSALSEPAARDILKGLRALLAEKNPVLQKGAAMALCILFTTHVPLQTLAEIDSLLAICLKRLESSPWRTRQALVDFVAALLIVTQVERTNTTVGKPKVARKE
ncbi:MAG: hypothetical protein CYPHOPRED_004847, partial [Cyphobasidiales sp. Tagirdzhanova-0007]